MPGRRMDGRRVSNCHGIERDVEEMTQGGQGAEDRVTGAPVTTAEGAGGAHHLHFEHSDHGAAAPPRAVLWVQTVWSSGRSAGAIGVAPVAIRRSVGHRRVSEVTVRRVRERPVVPQRVIREAVAGLAAGGGVRGRGGVRDRSGYAPRRFMRSCA